MTDEEHTTQDLIYAELVRLREAQPADRELIMSELRATVAMLVTLELQHIADSITRLSAAVERILDLPEDASPASPGPRKDDYAA